jgi:thiosulfate dehydrogenase [quinone] large subunit
MTPGMALLPLRLFLGLTFVYAGYQKLSDPGFLTPGAATYIGTQLHGFASGTPGGFLLRWFALPFPRAAGVGVALAEIAIGLLTAAGLLTRLAAAAGLDPLILGRQPVSERVQRRTGSGAHVYGAGEPDTQTRAVYLRRGLVAAGVATLSIGGLATAMRGAARTASATTALAGGGAHRRPHRRRPRAAGSTGPASSSTGTTGSTARPGVPSGAVKLGPASALKADAAALYRDPGDGSPDIVVRHRDGSLAAFSAVCTHAGCRVEYASGMLVCPCHGSEFDASTGAVIQGPAVTPLARRRVIQRRGSIYAV